MLDPHFWNQRYIDQNTPWDLGQVSPPIKVLLDRIQDPHTRILIPGAGRAYEAVYLHRQGFSQVYVCDWAEEAFGYLKENAPGFPPEHLICADFFSLQGDFDLLLEQTFFCAINPALRPSYVEKAHELLVPGGLLVGLLFASHFEKPGPPFGGTADEYLSLFGSRFFIEVMEISKNSILPRAGNELFIQLKRK